MRLNFGRNKFHRSNINFNKLDKIEEGLTTEELMTYLKFMSYTHMLPDEWYLLEDSGANFTSPNLYLWLFLELFKKLLLNLIQSLGQVWFSIFFFLSFLLLTVEISEIRFILDCATQENSCSVLVDLYSWNPGSRFWFSFCIWFLVCLSLRINPRNLSNYPIFLKKILFDPKI